MRDEDLERLPPEDIAELVATELPRGGSVPKLASGAPQPRILAEGDSWFAYPRSWILVGASSNTILQLHKLGGYDITSLASNGDEMVQMLSGSARDELVQTFASQHYDALLFSGGGNDIVGEYNINYIVEGLPAGGAASGQLHPQLFPRRLEQIERAYRDLLDLVKRFGKNPAMPVITHAYDNVIPTGKPAKFVGGLVSIKAWIKPYLDPLGVSSVDQQSLVLEMLDRFENMLASVEAAYPGRFHLVRTRGTISATDWKDEIHPNPDGFRKIAEKIKMKLDQVVP